MFRSFVAIMLAAGAALALSGCGKEPASAPSNSQENIHQAARTANILNEEISGIRQEMQKIRAQQLQWNESLNQLEARLNTIARENQAVADSLNAAIYPARALPNPPEKGGWSWSVKLLLVVAVAVIFYLIYKRVTREEEEDAADMLDEGFLEENDLGTVRYPGRKRPAEEEKPPESE